MSHITICGTAALRGELQVQRAKNSVLPIFAAALLHRGVSRIEDCPRLQDVETAAAILRHVGCTVQWDGRDLVVDATDITRCTIPSELMQRCRASILFLGALLGRCGEAELGMPGGCALGARPIDLHLAALRTLGADITECCPTLRCRAAKLQGRAIRLPFPSVGATENAMLAATAAAGVTVICGAAREPEIVDLQNFLQKLGFSVRGAGSSTIIIQGGTSRRDCSHRCIGDRIVAATYLCAAAAAGGTVTLHGAQAQHLASVLAALRRAGCRICAAQDRITLTAPERLHAIPPVRTRPYPGFPTDAQPLLMAALLRAQGRTMFTETIFENRYRHVPFLRQMGADICLAGRNAAVCGVDSLHGADVCATDLRCGAALVVAALSAAGHSRIGGVEHILRGYEDICSDLRTLGADIAFHQ